jgi:hypothetical protein
MRGHVARSSKRAAICTGDRKAGVCSRSLPDDTSRMPLATLTSSRGGRAISSSDDARR